MSRKDQKFLDREKIESFVNTIFSGHSSFMNQIILYFRENPKTENGKK